MSWKVILPVVALLLAAAPATLAEPTRPSGPSSPFKKYSCDQKHSICVEKCQRASRDGDVINRCLQDCAGKWLRCDKTAARTAPDAVTTAQPEPVTK